MLMVPSQRTTSRIPKRPAVSISGISKLSHRILADSYSSSVGHVTKIGMTQMGHMRAKDSVPNRKCQIRTQIKMRF
jgi:hypothetical protein